MSRRETGFSRRSRERSRERSRSPDWVRGSSRRYETSSSREAAHKDSQRHRRRAPSPFGRNGYDSVDRGTRSREGSYDSLGRDLKSQRDRRDSKDTASHRRSHAEDRYQPEEYNGRDYDDRRYESDDDHRRNRQKGSRQRRYAEHLEGGLDGRSDSYSDSDSYERSPRRSSHAGHWRGHRQAPSATLHVRGLPERVDEADMHNLFGSLPGVMNIRVMRDRVTNSTRGYAFVELESTEAAQDVMELYEHSPPQLPTGEVLRLTYSYQQPSSQAQGTAALDWVCNMCKATNFARRLECHQCSTARPENALRIETESDRPTHVLKISNVEPQMTEDALYQHFQQHARVTEVRLMSDRQGQPKGFGFAEFSSISEASKALHLLQESNVPGQLKKLRLCFAKDRMSSRPVASAAASNALEAAQAMSSYTAWTPQEFNEAALDLSTAADATAVDPPAQPGNGESTAPDSEFQYDSTSGYYYHAPSGYYYDANSGLYFDSSDQHWNSYDESSGQYIAVESQAEATIDPTAAYPSTDAGDLDGNNLSSLHAPEVEYKPPPEAKKRGAVIGSAPKLNPEGVLAAAREAKAREKEQQRLASIAAAKASKKGKKGRLQSSAINQRPIPPQAPTAAPQPAAAAATGVIKGVIRSSGKWGAPRQAT